MRRFSSREARTTFSTCSTDVLPTSVHTGAKHSASTRSPWSPSASTPRRRVHDVEPLAVALGAPVDRVLEGGLQHARYLARCARPDQVVVDLAHGHELGGGAGHEHLVGEVHLRTRHVALDDGVAEVLRDL